jgi:hypothetical protein
VSVEVLDYRLEVRGVAAGRQSVRSKDEGRHVRMEVEATFEGPLPAAKVVQLSRFHRSSHASYEFRETTRDRSGERRLRVVFDGRDGLVTLERGEDRASAPYVEPFRDPLSMLRELREAPRDADRIRMPMLGKTVEARALGEVELETPLGTKRAHAYQLFPGGSWVWIDAESPHAILRMRQRTDEALVDAILVGTAQDTKLTAWEDADRGTGGGKKRGRRRRRRRGGRSRSRRSSGSKEG